ncbi:MAG: hypothetical protein A2X18_13930 [Bacteroidetes bacterium GWF2_40_14]|nr:MAG: hypothetical protein A2X18_13930 [Bacteroidetes bacterium GWF2_40_14]
MRKILTTVAILLFGITIFAQTTTKAFVANSFNGISAGGIYEIELIKAAAESVVVETDKEIMPYVEVKVVKGILTFNLDNDRMPSRLKHNMGPIKAKVTMKDELAMLSLSGASSFYTASVFSPKSFSAQISGASNAKGLNIVSETAVIKVSGASTLSIKGKAADGSYEFSGASVATINQDMEKLRIECSGATKLEFTGKAVSVDIECSGATYSKFNGECETMNAEISGASKFDAFGFKVNEMIIEVMGVSSAKIFVNKSIEAETSGGSSIVYKGSPVVKNIDISSVSSFRKAD